MAALMDGHFVWVRPTLTGASITYSIEALKIVNKASSLC